MSASSTARSWSRVLGLRGELVQVGSAPRVLGAVAGLDEPQEQLPGQLLVDGIERIEDRVGGARDRAVHTAGAPVRVERERASVARVPRGAQRVREERKAAGLAGDLRDHDVDEAGVEPQADLLRRFDDGAPELGVGHRSEQHVMLRDRDRQSRVRGAPAVEVGADAEHDRSRSLRAAGR